MKKHLSYSTGISLLIVMILFSIGGNNLYARENKKKSVQKNDTEILSAFKKDLAARIEQAAKTPQLKSGLAISETDPQLAADSLILVEFYNSTIGASWTNNTHWLTGPVSTWYGITVASNRVTKINLKKNELSGTIPTSLGGLTSLQTLDLDTNKIGGTIPAELGNLTNLRFLHLDGNNLSGTIPVELGNLSNLTLLYLADNNLTDTIPTELANLTNLRWLDLSENNLFDTIPSQLGNLSNLEFLDLGSNDLTGIIPEELGQLTNMIWMDLRSNQFSGSIPNFGGMPNLEMLYLNSNNLMGSIPSELAQLTNLVWLHLGQNQLTGSIPVELSQLTDLQQLYLDGNQLTGSIPTELGLLTNLIWLNLSQNQLTGSIPVEFSNLINLELLYLDNNLLTGSIPAEMGQILKLRWTFLNNNLFSGTIPDELGDITNLEWLALNDNQLTGSVPLKLTQLTNLLLLHLNGNQLDYLPEYTSPNNLTDLYVFDNKISFEDLEYNMNVLSGITFVYSPQDSIGISETVTKSEGETFSYTLTTGGTQNVYMWYKNGILLPTQTNATIEINNLTSADAGTYYCVVTNTLVPGLTLTSREITLLMNYCVTINFNAGWNIFSSPVMPAEPDMKNIFQPFIDNNSLIKIQDELGNTLEDLGIYGDWKNNIGDIGTSEGYKVKMSDQGTINICGTPVSYPYVIPLKSGWNIIGYPQAEAYDGMDAIVQQLIVNGSLIKVQDEAGNTIEDLGIYGDWTNTIGDFVPGKGYKIKVNTDEILTIYESYPKSSSIIYKTVASEYFKPSYIGNGVDHMNIHLVNLSESGIMINDEIGVFDGSTCVGAAKVTALDNSVFSIRASAEDSTSEVKDGFKQGNDVQLKLYRNGNEYPLELIPVNSTSIQYEKNGSMIAKLGADVNTAVNVQDNNFGFACYPNPFQDVLNIEINMLQQKMLTVEIYDLLSRRVMQLYSANSEGLIKLQWDGKDTQGNKVAPGVYLCRVNETLKKVVLN